MTHGQIPHGIIVGEGQDSASALNAEIRLTGDNCPCRAYSECDPDDHCPLLEGALATRGDGWSS